MRKARAWLALVCVFCMLGVQQQACAQAYAAPVETYVVNRAIGGIIANRIAIARGIAANDSTWLATAANDPVYKATMAGVGKTMTTANVASTALGVGLAIAGAPVWLTIAASLGVIGIGAALVAGNTKLEVVSTASGNQWKVTAPAPTVTPPGYSTGLVQIASMKLGAQIYRDQACYSSESTCMWFPQLPTSQKFPYRWKPYPYDQGQWGKLWAVAFTWDQFTKFYLADLTGGDLVIDYSNNPGGQKSPYICYSNAGGSDDLRQCTLTRTTSWKVAPHWEFSGNGTPALFGAWMSHFEASPDNPNDSSYPADYGAQVSTQLSGVIVDDSVKPVMSPNLDGVYQAVSTNSDAMKQPVSQQTIAQIADAAWRNAAAQPGYAGQPYSASNPITADDVATWQQANPTAVPTLGDMLTPAQNPTVYPDGVPISPTVTVTGPSTNPTPTGDQNVNVVNTPNVNVVNTVRVDFGTDPNVASPTLEATPTGSQILQPLTSLFPEFRSFQTPQHVGTCPKPSFDVFGKSVVMDAQCTIAEQHRASLAAVMMVVWLLVGLFILLSA
jgi:hypothetical protein